MSWVLDLVIFLDMVPHVLLAAGLVDLVSLLLRDLLHHLQQLVVVGIVDRTILIRAVLLFPVVVMPRVVLNASGFGSCRY